MSNIPPGDLSELGSDVCYLLQTTNDVPEANINAGEWVVVYDEGLPIEPDQVVAYLDFTGGPVHIGVNSQLEDCIVQGRVVAVVRPLDAVGQEG